VRALRYPNGPPLSLGRHLRRLKQPKIVSTVQPLRFDSFDHAVHLPFESGLDLSSAAERRMLHPQPSRQHLFQRDANNNHGFYIRVLDIFRDIHGQHSNNLSEPHKTEHKYHRQKAV
jgi:hypothetical protein